MRNATTTLRRAAGAIIIALSVIPFWRLLPTRDTGLAGRATADIVGIQVSLLWSGFALVVAGGLVAGLFLSDDGPERVGRRLDGVLSRLSTGAFALLAGAISFVATAAAAHFVFEGRPNLVDGLAQLTHARYFAAGMLGGPPDVQPAFFHLQNMALTEAGWFSQYPPGHVLLLAIGMMAGAVWLVGPVVNGATAALTVLVFERLLPGARGLARGLGLMAGLSPMLVSLGATYMNHSSAALCGVAAVYCALRARDGGMAWALGAGGAVTAMAAIRPLSAVVVMVVVAVAIWLRRPVDSETGETGEVPDPAAAPFARWYGSRAALATLGGLPFLLLQFAYNRHAFGSAMSFGYGAAWGESHDLGFHLDPYGNAYGPIEALLYTSADLSSLNLNLLEIPIPLIAIAGLYLVLARGRLPFGVSVLAAWALLPVLANAFYWHHGYFMGPRMLTEFIPAWVGLAGVAVVELTRRAPTRIGAAGGKLSPRGVLAGIVLVGVLAGGVLGVQRVAGHGNESRAYRATPPVPPDGAALVFVPSSWEGRLIGRMVGEGVPPYVVETALRQNPTCLVHEHLNRSPFAPDTPLRVSTASGVGDRPPLDLAPRTFEYLPRAETAPGVRIRVDPDTPLTADCRREVAAEPFGWIDPSILLWLGDLPGIDRGAPMLARDQGPEGNEALLARHPERTPWYWGPVEPGGETRLVPYEEGMRARWGGG